LSEKPIIFSTEMVRAILDGRKSQTRRVIKLKYDNTHIQWRTDKYGTRLVEMQNDVEGETFGKNDDGNTWHKLLACMEIWPRYKVGDVLWVRENFYQRYVIRRNMDGEPERWRYPEFGYVASGGHPDTGEGYWQSRPSIHMPRAAARIFLRVTDVRAERVQSITYGDCCAEGVFNKKELKSVFDGSIATERFARLWNSINAKRGYGWDTNPWVWVYTFEIIKPDSFSPRT